MTTGTMRIDSALLAVLHPGTMRRVVISLILVVGTAVVPAAPAAAGGPECTYDGGSATVTVVPQGGSSVLLRSVDAITVDAVSCGSATVLNTDIIQVQAAAGDQITIHLGGGPFSPGATDEGDGASEIEIDVTGGGGASPIILQGSSGNDHFVSGTETGAALRGTLDDSVNLNADETVPDADLTYASGSIGTLFVNGSGGDDLIATTGWGDTVGPYDSAFSFRGGPGNDRMRVGALPPGGDQVFIGDADEDTLDLRSLPSAFTVIVDLRIGGLVGDGGSTTGLGIGYVERILGHGGHDELMGTGRPDTFLGGGGVDTLGGSRGDDHLLGGDGRDDIRAGRGDDALRGGPNADFLSGGPGHDRCETDGRDDITGCELVYEG
jgi:Ca2+-binding RTX toxin-like protein